MSKKKHTINNKKFKSYKVKWLCKYIRLLRLPYVGAKPHSVSESVFNVTRSYLTVVPFVFFEDEGMSRNLSMLAST